MLVVKRFFFFTSVLQKKIHLPSFLKGGDILAITSCFYLKSFYYFCIREIVITGKALVILSFSRPV